MGRRLQDCAGICLAEAMIAMAAGVVVLSATIQTLNHFQQKLWAQHDAIAHHQDLRVGMGVMEAELRVAGAAAPAIGTGLLKAEPQEPSCGWLGRPHRRSAPACSRRNPKRSSFWRTWQDWSRHCRHRCHRARTSCRWATGPTGRQGSNCWSARKTGVRKAAWLAMAGRIGSA